MRKNFKKRKPFHMNNKIIITGVGIFGSAVLWLLSFKIVAVLFGPAGVAIYSQLRQIIQATGTAATFGGGGSIVQGFSENSDVGYRLKFKATITIIVFFIALLATVGVAVFAPFIARSMLSSESNESVMSIQLLSVGVLLNAGAMCLMAMLNGYQALKSLAAVQVSTPFFIVFGLAFTPFVPNVNSSVVLAGLFVAGSALGFLSALIASNKIKNNAHQIKRAFLSQKEVFGFVRFSGAALIAALASSLTMLFVRAQVISAYGLDQAGLFDASWTLTFNYITLFLTACSILYLPRLSQAKDKIQQISCLQSTSYIVIACVTLITYLIVIFKSQFLYLLYSSEFSSAEKSLHILAAAVLIRSVSWVLSVLMVATKDSVALLLSELFFNFLLIVFTYFATFNDSAIDSVAWGLLVANFIYFMWMLYYVKQKNELFHATTVLTLLLAGLFFSMILFWMQQTATEHLLIQNIAFFCCALAIAFSAWRAFRKLRTKTQLSLSL